ncbi:Uncharacterised protein [Mycobacteroides abscessus subsp. abscessus]|nr:Uncharacterised protein [Mycobacteroides abscessus subsp. abscessus]
MARRMPPDWPVLDNPLVRGFDDVVDEQVAQQLRTQLALAKYPGWNFHAICWFDNGKFHAAVRSSGAHVATLTAATAQALVRLCAEGFDSHDD